MLAVDCVSFDATASRGVIQASKQFVQQLTPDDFVGLAAYPNGPKLAPTRDHAAVLRALDNVVGQRDLAELGSSTSAPRRSSTSPASCSVAADPRWTRSPGESVAIPTIPSASTGSLPTPPGPPSTWKARGRRAWEFCARVGDVRFPRTQNGGARQQRHHRQRHAGRPPDLADLGIIIGKEAALANTAVYTLFIDSSFIDRFTAQTRKGDKNLGNWNRDSALLSRWLEQFTGAAGGALFSIQVGNAESAFARIRSELASYYLLGVEPADEDRDGRTHEISVKTSHRTSRFAAGAG